MENMKNKDDKRAEYVRGLRAMADFFEQPEVPIPMLNISTWISVDKPEMLANISRKVHLAVKEVKYDSFNLRVMFSPDVYVVYFIGREGVCKRIEVGTEKKLVNKLVTPAVYEDVIEEVPIINWECPPSILKEFGNGES